MIYPVHHMMYPVHHIMYPIHHMMAPLSIIWWTPSHPNEESMNNSAIEWDIEKTISQHPLNSNSLILGLLKTRDIANLLKRGIHPSYDVPRPSYDGHPYPSYDGRGTSYDGFALFHVLKFQKVIKPKCYKNTFFTILSPQKDIGGVPIRFWTK